jgi:hypothetical protein
MSAHNKPLLGPVKHGIVVCADLQASAAAYQQATGLLAEPMLTLDTAHRELLGLPAALPVHSALLCNPAGKAVIQLLQIPGIEAPQPLTQHGWMALEILVADADASAALAQGKPGFSLLRPAADLDVSDQIRACQVAGPCGEVLYLTQVKGPVPPFELPQAQHAIDRLFIPVLCTPDRQASAAFYQALSGSEPLLFDTKITVVNQAHGLPLEQRHPVATLQFAGASLVEIDQLAMAETAAVHQALPGGIAAVVMEHQDVFAIDTNWQTAPRRLSLSGVGLCDAGLLIGPAGERVVLFSTTR